MLKKILFSLLFFYFTSFSFSSFTKEINGIAIVIDGDTLKIKNEKIRLSGIDSPEIKQTCKKPYLTISFYTFFKNYNCGEISKLKIKKYTKAKIIKCIFSSRDRYNRLIAECYVDNKNINSWMVKNGYAIAYRKYSKKFISEEKYAKKHKLGLWQGIFIMPEKWRKNKK